MRDDLPAVRYGKIDCFGSLEKAIAHTRHMLFQPFDLGKWFALGLIIFLSMLGSGGGGGFPNFNFPGGGGGGTPPGFSIRETIGDAQQFVADNLGLVVGAGLGIAVLAAGLTALVLWLGSRGRLMLVRAVALNDASIGENWTEAGKLSASLFWFSAAFSAISWAVMIGVAVLTVALVMVALDRGAETFVEFWPYVVWPVLVFLVYLLVLIPVGLLLNDFVVPVMYRFNLPCLSAWRIVLGMTRGNFWTLTLFYIIRLVIGIVKGIVVMLAACITCCVGALPIVSQTLTAPVHIFDRAFSMFALESMGPDFEMIFPVSAESDPFDDAGPRDLTDY